jgi:hypothetical protein
MALVDPIRFFREHHLQESLVIKFRYVPSEEAIELVIAYAAPAVSAWFASLAEGKSLSDIDVPPRDFRRLSFKQVSQGTRDGTLWTDEQLEFRLLRRSEAVVITCARLTPRATGLFFMELELQDHGLFTFNFKTLLCARRLGIGRRRRKSWVYFDAETHQEFDFYDPFGANT